MAQADLNDTEPPSAIVRWHSMLQQNRGARAALRRADSPLDFALVPAFHQLRAIVGDRWRTTSNPTLALIAQTLCQIDVDIAEPLGQSLAAAKVSVPRLRRFLNAADRTEASTQLRSLARRLRAMSITEATETILFWGEHRASQIAQAYFRSIDGKTHDANG